jgi:hypothetical protein
MKRDGEIRLQLVGNRKIKAVKDARTQSDRPASASRTREQRLQAAAAIRLRRKRRPEGVNPRRRMWAAARTDSAERKRREK